jgi:hypothetical protein
MRPALPTPFNEDDVIDAAAKHSSWYSVLVEHSHRIRDWLFAILRFAVTLDQSDRAAAMVLAREIDHLGSHMSHSGFSYFSKTSSRFCDCIVANNRLDNTNELRHFVKRIDDDRLRRAFEALLFEKSVESTRSRKADRQYLWKGLSAS